MTVACRPSFERPGKWLVIGAVFGDRAEAWEAAKAIAAHRSVPALLHDDKDRVVIRIEPGIDP